MVFQWLLDPEAPFELLCDRNRYLDNREVWIYQLIHKIKSAECDLGISLWQLAAHLQATEQYDPGTSLSGCLSQNLKFKETLYFWYTLETMVYFVFCYWPRRLQLPSRTSFDVWIANRWLVDMSPWKETYETCIIILGRKRKGIHKGKNKCQVAELMALPSRASKLTTQ